MNSKTALLMGVILSITLLHFLTIDNTDSNSYINGSYVCKDFSTDLIWNAYKFRLYLDYVYVEKYNHMMVGFYDPLKNTVVVIEPQNDQIVAVVSPDDSYYTRIPLWHTYQYRRNIMRY